MIAFRPRIAERWRVYLNPTMCFPFASYREAREFADKQVTLGFDAHICVVGIDVVERVSPSTPATVAEEGGVRALPKKP